MGGVEAIEREEEAQMEKMPWKGMQLSYLGRVDQILQISTGKLSQTGGDPGEPKKEKPH